MTICTARLQGRKKYYKTVKKIETSVQLKINPKLVKCNVGKNEKCFKNVNLPNTIRVEVCKNAKFGEM